jgi:serine kinase of HPr protein (carbohydrate metabolism regulator)
MNYLILYVMNNFLNKNLIFAFLENTLSIQPLFKNIYVKFYLKILLKFFISEKLQGTISVHGVILETNGRGILIRDQRN